MFHCVRYVDDQAMPTGHDFVFIVDGGDQMALFLRRSAVSPGVLSQAWAAYRAYRDRPPMPPPLHLMAVV